MEDFEEKYGLLVKYMLPSVNRCIDKIKFDGFVSGGESLATDNPKDEILSAGERVKNGEVLEQTFFRITQ